MTENKAARNPNMPLRGLIYFGKLYSVYAYKTDLDIYGMIPISLPTPKYVVLYNGDEDHGEETELLLSDLYKGEGDLEVRAHVVDINYEKGKEIFSNCAILEEYAIFVAKIRKYRDEGYGLNEATELAIDDCIREDVLKEILTSHKAEVRDMLITEFDQERYDRHRREEGRKEGITLRDELFKRMKDDGRIDEYSKAIDDEQLFEKLLVEYNIADGTQI